MSLLATARFSTSVGKPHQLPGDGLPEVAFAGRSNAGKSSALNALAARRRLAFASRTPGRTQLLNYFAVGPADAPLGYVVDTPGYGYAVAPGEVREAWIGLAGDYLHDRQPLVAVVLAMDSRRGPTALDHKLIDWMPPGVPLLILLTKIDKFGRQGQHQALRDARKAMAERHADRPIEILPFSATHRIGLDEATARIEAFFGWTAPAEDAPAGPAAGARRGADGKRRSREERLAELPAGAAEVPEAETPAADDVAAPDKAGAPDPAPAADVQATAPASPLETNDPPAGDDAPAQR